MDSRRGWSPYVAGLVIGLLQIPVFLLLHASLGTTGSLGAIASWVLGQGDLAHCFPYMKHWWQLGLIVGIGFGAYFSARFFGSVRPAVSALWSTILPTTKRWPRFVMAFCGGFLFLLGARIADGCTSGNGISGMAQLSIGSFVVIGMMFAAGIGVAFLYRRRNS